MAILNFRAARLSGVCQSASPPRLATDRAIAPNPITPIRVQDDAIARHQGIENALSMALHYLRTSDTTEGLQAAAEKVMRASALLNQACAQQSIAGGV